MVAVELALKARDLALGDARVGECSGLRSGLAYEAAGVNAARAVSVLVAGAGACASPAATVAAAVSGITAAYSGESFTDVFIILIVVLINAVLGVYQESKAEKAIEALQEMSAAKSKVLRDGKFRSFPAKIWWWGILSFWKREMRCRLTPEFWRAPV